MLRALAVFLALCGSSSALTTITDVIHRADGSLASGTMNIQWQAFRNAAGQLIPAGNIRSLPIVNGVFTIQLEPNTAASPAGTSYVVQYTISGSPNSTWRWYVPISASPVGLNTVQFPVAGLVGQTAVVLPTQIQQAGAVLGDCLVWNGAYWAPSTSCGGTAGATAFNAITAGTNTAAAMVVGSGASLARAGTGIVDANRILSSPIVGLSGTTGTLLETSGALISGNLLAADATSNAVDAGIPASSLVLTTGAYANPSWITSLAASKITSGSFPCSALPALTGDVVTTPGSCAAAVVSTSGVQFAPSATTNALNASNIAGGVLPAARLPAIDLALAGAGGGVSGNLPVANLNGGVNASSTTVWSGDGTWKSIASGGTVTNTLGALPAGSIAIGNGGNDITTLSTLGTSTTVLHGNATGNPSFGAIVLTADVSGILPTANGGFGTNSIIFGGVSGGAKTFTLPNVTSTILTSNAPVTLVQGGSGADFSAIIKGGLLVGTAAATLGIKTVGADGQVLTADTASAGGMKWAAVVGTGTVTSIATTSPITGGTITTTGTIACATCVTSAAALTVNQLVIGGAAQASVALGTLGTVSTVLHGNSGGAPAFTPVVLTTDVSGILPVANGGTGTASTLTGLVRGSGSAMTAAELSGDVTTSGSNAASVVKVNGAVVPTSAQLLASNGSNQLVAATAVSVASGKVLTASNTLTFTGTDGSSAAFGTGGTVTYTIAAGTSALGTSAIASGACATVVTTTATGTAATDGIIWTPNGSIKAVTGYAPVTAGGLSIVGYPTSNAVNWDVCNWTTSSITPGAATLNWRVVR